LSLLNALDGNPGAKNRLEMLAHGRIAIRLNHRAEQALKWLGVIVESDILRRWTWRMKSDEKRLPSGHYSARYGTSSERCGVRFIWSIVSLYVDNILFGIKRANLTAQNISAFRRMDDA
jgi:hypothetical protein